MVLLIPAQLGCGDVVSSRHLVRPRTHAVHNRIGVLYLEVREHGFQRAVVTEIACAQVTAKADPQCRGRLLSAFLWWTKQTQGNLMSWRMRPG